MQYPLLYLKKNEDRRVIAGHLWVYSNEIDIQRTPLNAFEPGQLVSLSSSQGRVLGIAYCNPQALLCARLLTRDVNQEIDKDFFKQRISSALALREHLFSKPFYRLIYAESDGLSGLIVDRYDQVLVVQINTTGMQLLQSLIIEALVELLEPQAIVLRNSSSGRELEGLTKETKIIYGEISDPVIVQEGEVNFQIDVQQGQKTGWFYDQRPNRLRMQNYVKEAHVLDLYSYVGAWGVQAALSGANKVVCVDSSPTAITAVQSNAKLNGVNDKVQTHQGDCQDIMKQLQNEDQKFNVIVLDPPAFIKRRKDIKAGTLAYQLVNEMAMRLLEKDGILITSSCSMQLPLEKLVDIVRRAGLKCKRQVQILEFGFQGPDHPVLPAIPETAYLKTLVCRVV